MLMPQGNIVTKREFDALAKLVAELQKQVEELKAKSEKRPYTRREVENGHR
jgi:hypothetical protein